MASCGCFAFHTVICTADVNSPQSKPCCMACGGNRCGLFCGALQGVGVQAPPCNCWWHGVGFDTLYMASTDGCACMGHASSVLYVSRSLSDRRAVHSSMCSNGCLQNTFPWAAGHSCVQACCNPAVSSLFLPAGVGVLLVGRELVARIQWSPRSPIMAGNTQGHCGVLAAVCPAGFWRHSGLWCRTDGMLTIPRLGKEGRQLI